MVTVKPCPNCYDCAVCGFGAKDAAEDERAAIVKWLREGVTGTAFVEANRICRRMAEAIAEGHHHR